MSRKMNDALNYVVAELKKVTKNAVGESTVKGEYTIYGEQPEMDWLTHAKLTAKVRLFPDFYVVWVDFQASQFLAVIGQEVQEPLDYLTYEALNAGIFSVLIYELKLTVLKEVQASDIEENVLNLTAQEAQNQGDKREAIRFGEITKYFPSIQFFKVDATKKSADLHQITGKLLTANELYYILPYQNTTIEKFAQLFEANIPNLLYDNILASYVASDFRFAYLDLYRCIEMLQDLNFYQPLYEEYKQVGLPNIGLVKFVSMHYEKTKIEPKNALVKLLSDEKTATKWSSLRNSIAHLRSSQTNVTYSETEWNQIICEMLDLIKNLYTTKTHLFS